MKKTFTVIAVACGVVFTLWAQTQFSLNQSIFINSSDNFPAIKAIKASQSNPWEEYSTGGAATYQVTYPGSILTTSTNFGAVTATGWTNGTGSDCEVLLNGNSFSITNFDSQGNAWMTNVMTTGNTVTLIIQANGHVNAPSGLSGNYHVL
jgi:hypothetical protein